MACQKCGSVRVFSINAHCSDLILFAIRLKMLEDQSESKKREVISNFCCVNEKYHCRNHEVEEFLRKWNWF